MLPLLLSLSLSPLNTGSHKRRDNRCGLSAPKLELGFTSALENQGWEVHRQLEDPSDHSSPLESIKGTPEERESEILRQLQLLDPQTAENKRALIIRNSHIGGHKFAGNCIVSFFFVGRNLILDKSNQGADESEWNCLDLYPARSSYMVWASYTSQCRTYRERHHHRRKNPSQSFTRWDEH